LQKLDLSMRSLRPIINSCRELYCFCKVEHYASSYGVSDVLKWVGRNCSFAKMFLPTATCEEINTLVASCYKNNQ
uniref:Ovule protein n=1 Tax=Haemonchus placei TaxID=6290 RepID=A0A0N4W5A0_HAEPC